MKREVLVISHADADGHIIAEQARRNLESIDSFNVSVIVDPTRTRDHHMWLRLDSFPEVERADLVFFMDMMFGPDKFAEEASALVAFASARPAKKFFLIDHHPFPLRRLEKADNVRMIYRRDVFDVAFGPRSEMMVVAALCEKQRKEVADIVTPLHEQLAVGMRRAAAHGGDLPGEKLLALLRANRWTELLDLASEDKAEHWLPRGRRVAGHVPSAALVAATEAATRLLSGQAPVSDYKTPRPRSDEMAYDMTQAAFAYDHGVRVRRRNVGVSAKDQEAILTLLEVAALSLTERPDATFTLDDLIRQAQELGGDEVAIAREDAEVVLEKANFVERVGKKELRFR